MVNNLAIDFGETAFLLPIWAWLAIAAVLIVLVILIIVLSVKGKNKRKNNQKHSQPETLEKPVTIREEDTKPEENYVQEPDRLEPVQEKQEEQPVKKEQKPASKPANKTSASKSTAKKTAAAKPAAKKSPAAKPTATSDDKVYHISRRKDENKWQIKAEGGAKAIKLFNTQAEAIEYAKQLADNQDARIMIHKADGSFRRLDYKNN